MKKKMKLDLILKKINFFNFNDISKKNIFIDDVCDLSVAKIGNLTFFSNVKYLNSLKNTKASAVFIKNKFTKYLPANTIPLICDFPEINFSKSVELFYPDSYFSKINYNCLSHAAIKKKYKTLKFGKNFYIENNVTIGKNVFIGNNVTIKKNCNLGNNVIIGSNVVIENSIIQDNVHICDGSIIGKKGFGFKFFNNDCYRIPHIGKVIIEDGCEIGSNCVIDRGSIRDTFIGKNTFLDNHVHIAHNVKIGNNCILAAQVGIAGSSTLGNNVVIGGQAGISGHLLIGSNVKIGGKSGVVKNIKDNEVVMGYPAKPIREFLKN